MGRLTKIGLDHLRVFACVSCFVLPDATGIDSSSNSPRGFAFLAAEDDAARL
eukprot:SAG31_NODE_442_length_15661_cov_4.132245_6_plen_52_part_00